MHPESKTLSVDSIDCGYCGGQNWGPAWIRPIVTAWLILALALVTNSNGQESEKLDPTKVVKKKQRIRVLGPDDKPVENAKFKAWGLNQSYFWPSEKMGPPINHTTNSEGITEIDYPESIGGTIRCNSINGVISHPDYIRAIARVTVNESKDFEIKLKQGVSFRIQAVDEDGKPLAQKFTVLMSGETPPEDWNDRGNGTIESKAIPTGEHQAIIVKPGLDGKTCFSEPLFIRIGDKDREKGVTLVDVEVYEGAKLTGKISEIVPRPIRNGQVMALQSPMPFDDKNNTGISVLRWGDWVPIREDGSFEFKSLPRTGKIQLIAKCDGFVGKDDGRRIVGETIESEDAGSLTLEMVRTMDIEVTVTDKSGLALSGVDIGFSPNQLWLGFGTQLLGTTWKSIDQVMDTTKSLSETLSESERASNFRTETDASGIARIHSVPVVRQWSYIAKEGYEIQEGALDIDKTSIEEVDGRRIFRKKVTLLKEEK